MSWETVVRSSEVRVKEGACAGKGSSLWKSVSRDDVSASAFVDDERSQQRSQIDI